MKVIGAQALVTAKILKLVRWIGEYYCCAPELALKSALPEAVLVAITAFWPASTVATVCA